MKKSRNVFLAILLSGAFAACGIEKGLQLVQRLIRGILLRPEAVRAQADQDGLFCFDSIILLHDYLQNSDWAPHSRRPVRPAAGAAYFPEKSMKKVRTDTMQTFRSFFTSGQTSC